MNNYDHIIWDWNGTLLDDTQACVTALNCCLKNRDLPPVTCDEYRRVFGFPVRDYYLKLGMTFTDPEWDELTHEFHRHYAQSSKAAPLRNGMAEKLSELSDQGTPMSVLSASETGILKRMMSERNIEGHFHNIRGLDNLDAHSKFDTGKALLEQLAPPAEKILFVGDTIHDFEVAAELGCRCVLLTGGHQAEDRIRACGCPVVSDLSCL